MRPEQLLDAILLAFSPQERDAEQALAELLDLAAERLCPTSRVRAASRIIRQGCGGAPAIDDRDALAEVRRRLANGWAEDRAVAAAALSLPGNPKTVRRRLRAKLRAKKASREQFPHPRHRRTRWTMAQHKNSQRAAAANVSGAIALLDQRLAEMRQRDQDLLDEQLRFEREGDTGAASARAQSAEALNRAALDMLRGRPSEPDPARPSVADRLLAIREERRTIKRALEIGGSEWLRIHGVRAAEAAKALSGEVQELQRERALAIARANNLSVRLAALKKQIAGKGPRPSMLLDNFDPVFADIRARPDGRFLRAAVAAGVVTEEELKNG
jgi:hypothetical protein